MFDQPLLSQPKSDPGDCSARGPPEIWVIRARWWEAAPASPAPPQLQRSRRTEQCSSSVTVFRDLFWIFLFRSSTSELTGKWTRSSPVCLRGSRPRANPSRRQRRRRHSGFFVVLESSACSGHEIRRSRDPMSSTGSLQLQSLMLSEAKTRFMDVMEFH